MPWVFEEITRGLRIIGLDELNPLNDERKLTRYFDPYEDKWDRRMLFEVTGIRLDEDEFLESDTSDEET